MSNSNVPNLPPVTAEQRRVAVGKFERANQVIATWNFDYGIHLLMDCCKIDPANLVYRQKLRATEKVKYRNNLRGSLFAKLTSWPIRARMKTALRSRDYLKVLEHGERIMMRNPWDVGAQMDMAEAADMLGLLDLGVWTLEQARQKQPLDMHVNRALARLYEKRGNFTQAIALWEIIRKVKPSDPEAQHKVKDLAADDTIARGQYHATIKSDEEAEELDEEIDVVDTDADHDPEQRAELAFDRDRITKALEELPVRLRTVIVLRDVYDLPHESIAAELGISEAAAKVRLHRARRKLHERLFPHRGDQQEAEGGEAHAV